MATTRSAAGTEPEKPAEEKPKEGEGGAKEKEEKEKERKATAKKAVAAACDELHAMRPQPRADEIEAVLDQIRTMEEPPKDEKGAKATAKQLYDKSHPKEEAKPVGAQSGENPASGAPAPA